MPCYSTIVNTEMKVADRIVEAALSFKWTVDQISENVIKIESETKTFTLSRGNSSQNFFTRDTEIQQHLDALQQQYNVEVTKNWASKLGYKAKEKKVEVKI